MGLGERRNAPVASVQTKQSRSACFVSAFDKENSRPSPVLGPYSNGNPLLKGIRPRSSSDISEDDALWMRPGSPTFQQISPQDSPTLSQGFGIGSPSSPFELARLPPPSIPMAMRDDEEEAPFELMRCRSTMSMDMSDDEDLGGDKDQNHPAVERKLDLDEPETPTKCCPITPHTGITPTINRLPRIAEHKLSTSMKAEQHRSPASSRMRGRSDSMDEALCKDLLFSAKKSRYPELDIVSTESLSPTNANASLPTSPHTPDTNMSESLPFSPHTPDPHHRTFGGFDAEKEVAPLTPPHTVACAPLPRPPETPQRGRLQRSDSLFDSKVLMTTQLKRTRSIFGFSEQFEFIRHLGSGAFSQVYLAQNHAGQFAIKKSKRQFKGKKDRENYLHEIKSVANLSEHPNIVRYFQAWQEEAHFFVQTEYCPGGSLQQKLANSPQRLGERDIWNVLKDVACGLKFIHENMLLHLDIKPDNLFYDDVGTLKIGDFGSAVLDNKWEVEEGDCVYLAREMLDGKAGPFSDVFSLAIVIYQLSSHPEELPRNGAAWQQLRDGHFPDPLMDRSDRLRSTLMSMLQPDVYDRPSAAALVDICNATLASPQA